MLAKLQERRAELMIERDKYNYDLEQKEVDKLTQQLNQVVEKRNNKQSLYDTYDKEIKRIDDMVAYVDELERKELPDEPVEESIEEENE